MALPETDLTIDAIKDYLPSSSNDLGELCLSSSINRYSKKKPVRYERSGDDWYRCTNNRYSLYIPYYNNTDSQEWDYQKPLGGSGSPYDMGHFRGYYKDANYPIEIPVPVIGFEMTRTYTFVGFMPISGERQITLADLGLRLGVELRRYSDDSLMGWASGALGSSSVTIDLSTHPSVDIVNVRFFLTDVTKEWGDNSSVGETRYSMPRGSIKGEVPRYVNRFWENITVVPDGVTPSPYFQVWTAAQNGSNFNRIEVTYKPRGYTGTCEVTVRRKSDNWHIATFQINVSGAWTLSTYTHIISLDDKQLEEDTTYTVKGRWIDVSGVDPALVVGETEFITFTQVD